jgi:protein-disulfide isomerase
VLERYPTQVKLVKKSFPLPMHRFARKAAMAALAAGEQGKFWEYNDLLFKNYNKLSDQKFLDFAQQLGLDMTSFRKGMTDPKLQALLNKNRQDGAKAGVTGTPSIFINGRRLKNRSLQGFEQIINAELKKK